MLVAHEQVKIGTGWQKPVETDFIPVASKNRSLPNSVMINLEKNRGQINPNLFKDLQILEQLRPTLLRKNKDDKL